MAEPKVRLNLALSLETDAQLQTIIAKTSENATSAINRLVRQEFEKITKKTTSQDRPGRTKDKPPV